MNVLLTLSQTTNFGFFNLKEFADNNFEFDEKGKKIYKRVENIVRKGDFAHNQQFLFFQNRLLLPETRKNQGLFWNGLKVDSGNIFF